jgi:hypothetical protein
LLSGSNGDSIQSFRYDDGDLWSQNADGEGYSLTLIAPSSRPDPGNATSWRSSLDLGGSPGASDALIFTGTTSNDFLSYALTDPFGGISASIQSLEVNGAVDDYLVTAVSANTGADDAEISVEFSADLETWLSGAAVFLGSDERVNGMSIHHWRAPTSSAASPPFRFARVVLVARP